MLDGNEIKKWNYDDALIIAAYQQVVKKTGISAFNFAEPQMLKTDWFFNYLQNMPDKNYLLQQLREANPHDIIVYLNKLPEEQGLFVRVLQQQFGSFL